VLLESSGFKKKLHHIHHTVHIKNHYVDHYFFYLNLTENNLNGKRTSISYVFLISGMRQIETLQVFAYFVFHRYR
jgi:hypothetical protein